VAEDAHVPAAAREETSSPQKNAYRIPGLRFTQRTGDMVYIGFEDLRFPSLCFSGRYLVCCLEWNAEGRLIVPLLAGQKRRA
jgi:hypothetical protein